MIARHNSIMMFLSLILHSGDSWNSRRRSRERGQNQHDRGLENWGERNNPFASDGRDTN